MKKTNTKTVNSSSSASRIKTFRLVHSGEIDHLNRAMKQVKSATKRFSRTVSRQPFVKYLDKQRSHLAVGALILALCLTFSTFSLVQSNCAYYQANQQFIDNYLSFMGKSYGQLFSKTFNTWGEIVYQLKYVPAAVGDTVVAYAAMFKSASDSIIALSESSGKLIARASYALSTPARVLAINGP